MAQVLSATVGDVVRIRRHESTSWRLLVSAPDGSTFSFPADQNSFELWVPQVGTWTFQWNTEIDVRQIVAVEAEVVVDETPVEPVDLPLGRLYSRGG